MKLTKRQLYLVAFALRHVVLEEIGELNNDAHTSGEPFELKGNGIADTFPTEAEVETLLDAVVAEHKAAPDEPTAKKAETDPHAIVPTPDSDDAAKFAALNVMEQARELNRIKRFHGIDLRELANRL